MLPCPLYQFTHLQCPYCGVQRALLAVLQGEWLQAWQFNPFFWVTLPYLLLLVLGSMQVAHIQQTKLYRWAHHNATIFGYAIIALLWGVVRNMI